MTGSNCSIVGCNTTRKHKDIGQLRCPDPKKYPQWNKEFLSVVTRDRVVDDKFKKQIEKNNVYVCQRHFKDEDLWHYSHCVKLKDNVLPSLNLPIKSHSTSKTTPRSSASISKREQSLGQDQIINVQEALKLCYASYYAFVQRVTKLKLSTGWTVIDKTSYFEAKFFEPESRFTAPKYEIFVNKNLGITLRCYGWAIPENAEVLNQYKSFNDITFSDFVKMLGSYKICEGLDLVEFKEAIHLKHHVIPIMFQYPHSLSPDADAVPLCQKEYLRASTCPLLIKEEKCPHCSKMEIKVRSQLNQKKRVLKSPVQPNAPLSFASTDRLISTIQMQRQENKSLHNTNEDLKQRLQAALEKRAVPVEGEINDALVDIFEGIPDEKVPPFMKLFWQEQQKYLKTEHKGQLRYHPAIIKYCLSIAAKSSSAYEQLRVCTKDGTGVLILPSQRTLRSYRNYIRTKQGFNPDIVQDLKDRTENFSDSERYVNILIDEMKIQEDLVWNKHTGELIGFVDFGDDQINEALIEDREKLATHIMVFLVKSIKNPLSYAFANFATDGASSSQIFALFWKCVGILEISCNLKVIATVADGASINRRFMQMNRDPDDTDSIVYRVLNRFAEVERYIYFFADAPHLMKTARNCLWSSGADFSNRLLWNSGDFILWSHIKSLYHEDVENGLHMLPKLTTDHIMLTSYSKMRVYLATQILSESVGKTLRDFGPKAAKSTAEFCLKFDQFFDCFNVRNTEEGKENIKPFLEPYRKDNLTERFEFFDNFLAYLSEWKESIDGREGDFTPTQRNNMFLSLPTYNGVQMSIKSLKEIVPFLLDNGFDYVLSEKFCQDDLENYFGRQRAIGRRMDNPNAAATIKNDLSIKSCFETQPIAGANCIATIDKTIPETPLKKMKK